jgi:TolB-like protein
LKDCPAGLEDASREPLSFRTRAGAQDSRDRKHLLLAGRNSSFTYKGRTRWPELGVRYVAEGSVRRSESRIGITGQLVDALAGTQLWTDRFVGRLNDIFELQD